MTKRIKNKAEVLKFVKSLIYLHDDLNMSWRSMAFGCFPKDSDGNQIVQAGTLNRIANSNGEWLPKNMRILDALGLLTERSPYAVMPRWWMRTPEALAKFLHIRGKAQELSDDTRRARKIK